MEKNKESTAPKCMLIRILITREIKWRKLYFIGFLTTIAFIYLCPRLFSYVFPAHLDLPEWSSDPIPLPSSSKLSTWVVFLFPLVSFPSFGCHVTSLIPILSVCLMQCPATRILVCFVHNVTFGTSWYKLTLVVWLLQVTWSAILSIFI